MATRHFFYTHDSMKNFPGIHKSDTKGKMPYRTPFLKMIALPCAALSPLGAGTLVINLGIILKTQHFCVQVIRRNPEGGAPTAGAIPPKASEGIIDGFPMKNT